MWKVQFLLLILNTNIYFWLLLDKRMNFLFSVILTRLVSPHTPVRSCTIYLHMHPCANLNKQNFASFKNENDTKKFCEFRIEWHHWQVFCCCSYFFFDINLLFPIKKKYSFLSRLYCFPLRTQTLPKFWFGWVFMLYCMVSFFFFF